MNHESSYTTGKQGIGHINGICKSAIQQGFMILVGIEYADNQEDIDWLCKKIVNLRVFDDENGVMNKSILDAGGDILVISQFTLHASTKKGNRPSYIGLPNRKSPSLFITPFAGIKHSTRQRSENRRIRCRHESRTFK